MPNSASQRTRIKPRAAERERWGNMNNETNLYPAGHIRYSFEMYDAYEQAISCNLVHPAVREIILEKVNPSDIFSPEWQMTIHFGPIHSIEDVDETGDAIKDELFDMLSFTLNTRIAGIRLTGHGLTPRSGEGGIAHLLLPPLRCNASAKVGCFPLSEDSVKQVQNTLSRTSDPRYKALIGLFRHAISTDEPIVQFLILYLILYDTYRNQHKVDKQILSHAPTTPQSVSPHDGKTETIYTRLRNELTHRTAGSPETTRKEIMNNLDSFRTIVHRIIESSAP